MLAPARSQTSQTTCAGTALENQADFSYQEGNLTLDQSGKTPQAARNQGASSQQEIKGTTARSVNNTRSRAARILNVARGGVRDGRGRVVLGAVLGSLRADLIQQGVNKVEATRMVRAIAKVLVRLRLKATLQQASEAIDKTLTQSRQGGVLDKFQGSKRERIATLLIFKLAKATLRAANLTEAEADTASRSAYAAVVTAPDQATVAETATAVLAAMTQAVPGKAEIIDQTWESLGEELNSLRRSQTQTALYQGQILYYRFILKNADDTPSKLLVPMGSGVSSNPQGANSATPTAPSTSPATSAMREVEIPAGGKN
ncbi:hypothetical protein DO97_15235 [Neosynechococcus sphagnicola sy1]|uniref:Uncharacterized protein n=1 Tax=Neosynechococcus sphagnicola sy1 TaxID=1497020 RepID=A0A098TMU7_9CYAN|nr:hypothetical protein [Neosynechococcus sphagnicola]KGF73655.1 hypothetical protein DO97_15235 [Neosynechococcus sphagnicola sy1]